MNREFVEEKFSELPLLDYHFLKTEQLFFTERVRHICKEECPMYGKTWACPPAVGSVEECMAKCREYENFVLISTLCEVNDISNIEETLATRPQHESVTRQCRDILREAGVEPYVLSCEACSNCERCAYLDGEPCRHPEDMFPCIESHGILVTMLYESCGIEFQYGGNIVTWFSLLLYND